MVKTWLKIGSVVLLIALFLPMTAYAQDASFQSRCEQAKTLNYPPCANSPSECGSKPFDIGKDATKKTVYRTPFNCIFLQEPIGGKTGYDLYKIVPVALSDKNTQLNYTLWYGEAIIGTTVGPVQAVLTFEPGKDYQGPFGLLYNYLGLIYNWLSGIIIGFVILISIVGGIRMTVSAGNQSEFDAGKKMIIHALIGMALWFTASVILYTINPTFFAF